MGPVVVDSNIVIAVVVHVPYTLSARKLVRQWAADDIDLVAPLFWEYEIFSALRKFIYVGHMKLNDAFEAMEQVFSMNVTTISQTIEGYKLALQWADRLGNFTADNAQYLALTEQLEADFWTADRRLAHLCQQAGASWVHWLGEGG